MNTIFKSPLAELKEFYSLAPNRAKDPRFWLSLEVLIQKLPEEEVFVKLKTFFKET